jgi:hypothetical protein
MDVEYKMGSAKIRSQEVVVEKGLLLVQAGLYEVCRK